MTSAVSERFTQRFEVLIIVGAVDDRIDAAVEDSSKKEDIGQEARNLENNGGSQKLNIHFFFSNHLNAFYF